MCGIAGFYSNVGIRSGVLEDMADAIRHRGPDDEGYYAPVGESGGRSWKHPGEGPGEIQLGMTFRRLSILDLSPTGAQPMTSADGRYVMCFNGEIYNYLELKRELSGINFRSTGDTEVLLELFARHQENTLAKLNGMFAISVYDKQKKVMWLVRDHFGVKPLYYFKDERGLFYASEIRALLRARLTSPRLNRSLVARYLMVNWIPDPDTLFEGIQKLEPGHFLKIESGVKVTKHRYWDLDFRPEGGISVKQWRDDLDRALNGAVERQLRSDVPVAFFLSGGLDSSLLAAKALAVQKQRPTTFTIGFRWNRNSDDALDLESAREVSKEFNFDHREIILEPSIVSLLPKVVKTLEEPIADPAAICSHLICEAAASHFKVLISGQGGDELFGGYPVYRGGMIARGAQQLPSSLMSVLKVTSQVLPYSVGGHRIQAVHKLKKLFFSASHVWPEPFFILRSAMGMESTSDLLTSDALLEQESPFARHWEHYSHAKDWDTLHQAMYLDTKTYLPCLNLTYTDKTSMAHSVEVRVPFLDKELADLVQRLPSALKMNLRESKRLLKIAARKELPRKIIDRKKTGFGLPIRDWFLRDLQPMAQDLLSESRLKRQGLFRPEVVARWLKEHREMTADHGMKIYSLMTFQLWCEGFEIST